MSDNEHTPTTEVVRDERVHLEGVIPPDDLEAVTARLSAVTDALDREKLARAIKRADDDWYAEKPGTGRGVTITAWSRCIADAVRRHVLGEEAEHG